MFEVTVKAPIFSHTSIMYFKWLFSPNEKILVS